ncbi:MULTISPECIES: toll/interleukin-1 receptor domain-containing protein [unclassified Methylobacterium]|uniref:toll/interleukin-1 receptor domain-containing protein n=1 Tax=unclassified Methylobacterium TaxID=2615210 RepID=UPI00226A567B|nr:MULTISPECIES: toll/interleukin-1 receptor domain-containing protein [unclassified Methylobacterium]
MLTPTGFWSYTTSDESAARGKLSQLRALLTSELQQQVGREPKVNIFQDVAAIPPGGEWETQIRTAIGTSSFLIPIVTPAFLQSEWCCREVSLFRQREAELGVRCLVFPLHYVNTDHIDGDDPSQCHDAEILAFLKTRQWTDFRAFRLQNQEGENVAVLLEGLARGLLKALRDGGGKQGRASRTGRDKPLDSQDSKRPRLGDYLSRDFPNAGRLNEETGRQASFAGYGDGPATLSATAPISVKQRPSQRTRLVSLAVFALLIGTVIASVTILRQLPSPASAPPRDERVVVQDGAKSSVPCSAATQFSEWNGCARLKD